MSERFIAGCKAVVVVAVCTLVAGLLQYGLILPAFGQPAPKLILVLAILAAAAYAGFWTGLLATAICMLIAIDTTAPDFASATSSLQSTVTPLLLGLTGLVASVLAEELHRARRRVERRQTALQKEIADRRVVEQRVADSEARFRELAESLPDIMFATDSAGTNEYTNRRWFEYTGAARPTEGDAPLSARDVIHPDDLERVRDAWRVAMAHRTPYETRHRLRAADGTYRWFIARARPVWRDGDDSTRSAPRWFGVATDIDAQMRAEESLRDREEQLRLALESTGLGVFEIELTTRRLIWSDRCRSIFGYSPNAALSYRTVRAAIHPEDRMHVVNAINRSRDPAGSGEFSFEMRVFRPDGDERIVAARGRSFFVGNRDKETAVRCIGTMLDITERRKNELQLRNNVAELQQAERSLRDADRRKDEFLAILAHELRNPLAPMRTALQLINAASDDRQTVAYARDLLDRQVAIMVRLIDDLLDVGRITSGKLNLRRERVALQSVIDSALETARPLISERRQSIVVDAPSQPLMIDCDPARISQVLSNLLNNAARYTPPLGRIKLSVDAKAHDAEVEIKVSDEGAGIAPDAIDSVFTMFSQAGASPGEGHAGLGVGLPLARALTALHGGTIEARSAGIGCGAELIVRLPCDIKEPTTDAIDKPPQMKTVDAPTSMINGDAALRRVLVIDDNQDAAESMAALLRLSGHEVAVGHDGAQALQLAEQFKPQILLLDISMPKMNGHEAARKLRQTEWGKPIYIVALSGFGQDHDRARSLEAGCNAHYTKPLSPQDLDQALAGARDTHAMR
ncbi:MAG: hybrid sensor histidine kinase/response regulator [Burkholderiaceae bacterium]